MKRIATLAVAGSLLASVSFAGQAKPVAPAQTAKAFAAQTPAAQPGALTPPDDYVVGVGDVLIITYWEEPKMSSDAAVVRPDGKITLPLINDVDVRGMRTDQLQVRLTELSKDQGLKDPRVSVGVRAINSRRVFIQGGVVKGGAYDLNTPMTVLQLISLAGTKEFVSGKNIRIIREENGKKRAISFNLQEVQEGKNLDQDIPLKPGDTIIVPE